MDRSDLEISPVENRLVVANVVNGDKLRRVQEMAAAHAIDGHKVAPLAVPISQAETAGNSAGEQD